MDLKFFPYNFWCNNLGTKIYSITMFTKRKVGTWFYVVRHVVKFELPDHYSQFTSSSKDHFLCRLCRQMSKLKKWYVNHDLQKAYFVPYRIKTYVAG